MTTFTVDNPSSRSVRQDFSSRGSVKINRRLQLPNIVLPPPPVPVNPSFPLGNPNGIVPLGFPGGLSYERNTELVHYSDGMQWLPLRGDDGFTQIIWNPNGVSSNFVGTTWQEVMNIVNGFPTEVRKRIILGGATGAADPFIIPAGVYDLTNTVLATNIGQTYYPVFIIGNNPELRIRDGVKLNGLRAIYGPMNVVYEGLDVGPPYNPTQTGACVDIEVVSGGMVSFYIEGTVTITCVGTAPFVEYWATAVNLAAFVMHNNCNLIEGTAPVIRELDAGGLPNLAILVLDHSSLIGQNTLGGASLNTYPDASDFRLFLESVNTIGGLPVNLTTFTAAFTTSVPTLQRSDSVYTTTQGAAPVIADDQTMGFRNGDIWIDSTGPAAHILLDQVAGTWSAPII